MIGTVLGCFGAVLDRFGAVSDRFRPSCAILGHLRVSRAVSGQKRAIWGRFGSLKVVTSCPGPSLAVQGSERTIRGRFGPFQTIWGPLKCQERAISAQLRPFWPVLSLGWASLRRLGPSQAVSGHFRLFGSPVGLFHTMTAPIQANSACFQPGKGSLRPTRSRCALLWDNIRPVQAILGRFGLFLTISHS